MISPLLLKNVKILALGAALALTLLLLPATPLKAAPEGHQALKLMGKADRLVQNRTLSLNKLPGAQSPTAPSADSRDQLEAGTGGQRQKGAGIFFNMKREVEVESEIWHGSTGLQINW
ncbi:MAG: hypothetical protein LBP33_00595 [Candidatus Adiutrix sp.]|jgi:hypothetical protein|nr:hypothetical protein [Candidatus Adiutrix sp.]